MLDAIRRFLVRLLLAIELDDSSHRRYDNSVRDAYKDRVCSAVGLPLWRVKVQREYAHDTLRAQVEARLSTSGWAVASSDPRDDRERIED